MSGVAGVQNVGPHCLRKGCRCTHDSGCYRGWIGDGTVRRCPVCSDRSLPAPSDQHDAWGLQDGGRG